MPPPSLESVVEQWAAYYTQVSERIPIALRADATVWCPLLAYIRSFAPPPDIAAVAVADPSSSTANDDCSSPHYSEGSGRLVPVAGQEEGSATGINNHNVATDDADPQLVYFVKHVVPLLSYINPWDWLKCSTRRREPEGTTGDEGDGDFLEGPNLPEALPLIQQLLYAVEGGGLQLQAALCCTQCNAHIWRTTSVRDLYRLAMLDAGLLELSGRSATAADANALLSSAAAGVTPLALPCPVCRNLNVFGDSSVPRNGAQEGGEGVCGGAEFLLSRLLHIDRISIFFAPVALPSTSYLALVSSAASNPPLPTVLESSNFLQGTFSSTAVMIPCGMGPPLPYCPAQWETHASSPPQRMPTSLFLRQPRVHLSTFAQKVTLKSWIMDRHDVHSHFPAIVPRGTYLILLQHGLAVELTVQTDGSARYPPHVVGLSLKCLQEQTVQQQQQFGGTFEGRSGGNNNSNNGDGSFQMDLAPCIAARLEARHGTLLIDVHNDVGFCGVVELLAAVDLRLESLAPRERLRKLSVMRSALPALPGGLMSQLAPRLLPPACRDTQSLSARMAEETVQLPPPYVVVALRLDGNSAGSSTSYGRTLPTYRTIVEVMSQRHGLLLVESAPDLQYVSFLGSSPCTAVCALLCAAQAVAQSVSPEAAAALRGCFVEGPPLELIVPPPLPSPSLLFHADPSRRVEVASMAMCLVAPRPPLVVQGESMTAAKALLYGPWLLAPLAAAVVPTAGGSSSSSSSPSVRSVFELVGATVVVIAEQTTTTITSYQGAYTDPSSLLVLLESLPLRYPNIEASKRKTSKRRQTNGKEETNEEDEWLCVEAMVNEGLLAALTLSVMLDPSLVDPLQEL